MQSRRGSRLDSSCTSQASAPGDPVSSQVTASCDMLRMGYDGSLLNCKMRESSG